MLLQSDLSEFVGLLNSLRVEFVVVGGYAVAFHGHPRFTGDIDLFVRPTEENADKILEALRLLGFEGHGIRSEDLSSTGRIVQLGNPPNRIDLLTSLTGVDFDHAWTTRVTGRLGDHEVSYLGLEALVTNKLATGRGADEVDVQKLRARREEGD